MEHPLHANGRYRREFLALARALLYSEETAQAHLQVLRAAFGDDAAERRLRALAVRTVVWASNRPQPRLKALVQQLRADGLVERILQRHGLRAAPGFSPQGRMRSLPGVSGQLGLESVDDLAQWLRLEYGQLLWFADLKDRNRSGGDFVRHYRTQILSKPYGAVRLLEAPKQRLREIQRQILQELLMPIPAHPAVHGFCRGRSILSFATPHVAREAVLRVDLQEFFPSISGARVQALFRTLGYPEAVADLLGGLCTTTAPRGTWRQTGLELDLAQLVRARLLYNRPHLPQGAPTSPAISNLCAFRLDCRIGGLAKAAGVTYTRYADDLAFSGDEEFARNARRFAQHVFAIIAEEGFTPHYRKTRLMRPSVRQHLCGITVNVRPNLRRRDLDLLEATLTNCVRYGPESQNREGHADFRRHLEGRVGFAAMVNGARAERLRELLVQIAWPDAG